MAFFSKVKRNKETILYFIITILCLEHVRRRHNKLEDTARKENWNKDFLRHKQNLLVIKAGMIYAIFFSLVILSAFSVLTARVTSVYSGTDFLRTGIALVIELILSYILSFVIIKFALRSYIRTVSGLTGFWKKLGRSAWDGTKVVTQAPVKAGTAMKKTISKSTKLGVKAFRGVKSWLGSNAKKTTNFISKKFKKN